MFKPFHWVPTGHPVSLHWGPVGHPMHLHWRPVSSIGCPFTRKWAPKGTTGADCTPSSTLVGTCRRSRYVPTDTVRYRHGADRLLTVPIGPRDAWVYRCAPAGICRSPNRSSGIFRRVATLGDHCTYTCNQGVTLDKISLLVS
jgi:hypothetical protein